MSKIVKLKEKKVYIQHIQIIFILSILSAFSLVIADENPKKSGRLNTGYYFNSMTENASRTEIEISLNFWAKELVESEGKKNNFEITSSRTYLFDRMEDMRKAFDQGSLDMISAPPLLISKFFKPEELGNGFVGALEGKRKEAVLLIAKVNNKVKTIKDLPGKRIGLKENDELAEIFLDTLILKELHKSFKKINLSFNYQNKSDRIILDVFFDKVDAGVTYSSSYEIMAELNPDIKNKVKILSEYPIKGKNFVYFHHDYPLMQELTAIALGFEPNSRGKQILEIFKTPELDYCNVEELENFSQFYKNYLELKKNADK